MIKTNEFRLNEKELKTAYHAMRFAYISRRNNLLILASYIIFVLLIPPSHPQIVLFIFFISFYLSLTIGFNQFKKNPLYRETSFIEINDDFISQTYKNGCVLKLNLNLIQWVVKKDNVYVFMRQNQMPLIFPARALTSGEEVKLPLRKNVVFHIYD